MASPRKSCFPPIADARARVLILGTLPGDESLRKGQYYGHPQNQFWRIIYECFGRLQPKDYDARVRFVQSNGVAVWDVLASAVTDGSLDTKIQNAETNDFTGIFSRSRKIEAIGFNGRKAHAHLLRHVGRRAPHILASVTIAVLPSTSPAATSAYSAKLAVWQAFLRQHFA